MNLQRLIIANIYALLISSTWALPLKVVSSVDLYKLFSVSLLFLAIIWTTARLILNPRKQKILHKTALLNLVIFGFFILIGFISGTFNDNLINAFLGATEYCLFLFPLLILSLGRFPFSPHAITLVKLNTFFAVIIGVIGVYQYFFDSLLWGLYIGGEMESLYLWSVKRIPSTMGSIQVYAAYMSFSALALFLIRPFSPANNKFITFVVIILGTLSGGQTYFLMAIVLIACMLLEGRSAVWRIRRVLVLVAMCSLIFLMWGDWVSEINPIMRFAGLFASNPVSYFNEMNSLRLEIWTQTIKDTPFIAGNGFGAASLLVHGAERINTESYLLSVYYESGIIGLVFMVWLLLNLCTKGQNIVRKNEKLLIVLFVMSYAITVHVYYSVFLFIFWLVIFLNNGRVRYSE